MGRDRISELPDSLLTHILLNLPTKDSVKTSALSKRWEFLWLRVPGLDLTSNDLRDDRTFPNLVDNFLEFNHESRMQKLKIKYDEYRIYDDRFVEWIGEAINRGVRCLDVENNMEPPTRHYMPQNIYKSNDLVSLKLVQVGMDKPKFLVSLPRLKIMHLNDVLFDDDPLIMEKVILGCPVLEDLTFIRPVDYYEQDILVFLRVRSLTLKRFRYSHELSRLGKDFSFEIDAPGLEYFSFKDNQSDRIVVKNLKSLLMIDIDSDFNVTSYGGWIRMI